MSAQCLLMLIDFSDYTQLTRLSSGRANIVDQTQIN